MHALRLCQSAVTPPDAGMDGGRSLHAREPHRTPGGRTGRVKPTTGRRVGVTRAARPALADVNYHKVLPLGVGAGHRVGIPSGAAVTPNG